MTAPNNQMHFEGQTYEVKLMPNSWEEAQTSALASGGYLAQISSTGENDAIYQLAMSQYDFYEDNLHSAPDGGGSVYVWLGGNDATVEGTWHWSDGSLITEYSNWGSGSGVIEPDNFEGLQDHLGMALEGWPYPGAEIGASGEWNDIQGSNRLWSVIEFDGLQGTENNDRIVGSKMGEHFLGGLGNDELIGKAGRDWIEGNGGSDLLVGGGGRDKLFGHAGRDSLQGGFGNDVLKGGNHNDQLSGGNGKDRLFGGGGRDHLDGGAGNDRLIGGGQADTFVFRGNFGEDTIVDFNATKNAEKIDLSAVLEFSSMNDILNNHVTQNGDNIVIDDGQTNTITLLGVQLSDLGAGDFIF